MRMFQIISVKKLFLLNFLIGLVIISILFIRFTLNNKSICFFVEFTLFYLIITILILIIFNLIIILKTYFDIKTKRIA